MPSSRDSSDDVLVQEHKCGLGCDVRIVSQPGRNVEIWSRDSLRLAIRPKPDEEQWLVPALQRALAHAIGPEKADG